MIILTSRVPRASVRPQRHLQLILPPRSRRSRRLLVPAPVPVAATFPAHVPACYCLSLRPRLLRFLYLQLPATNNVSAAAPGLREPLCSPATHPDAATAASGATQRSCNASRRCNCCFWAHATLLQCFRSLQLSAGATQRAFNASGRLN